MQLNQRKHIQIAKMRLGEYFEQKASSIIDYEFLSDKILSLGREIFPDNKLTIIPSESFEDKSLSSSFCAVLYIDTETDDFDFSLTCNITYCHSFSNIGNTFLSVTKDNLHSFENGKIFIDTTTQSNCISIPNNEKEFMVQVEKYLLFIKNQMEKAIEEEKIFTPGEISYLDDKITKQEIRENLFMYKLVPASVFILMNRNKTEIDDPENPGEKIYLKFRMPIFYENFRSSRNSVFDYSELESHENFSDEEIVEFLKRFPEYMQ